MAQKREAARIELKQDVQLDSLISGLFLSRVAEQDLRFQHQEGWRTAAGEPQLGEPLKRTTSEERTTSLYELDGALLLFGFYSGHVFAAVAANEQRSIDTVLVRLHELLPPPDPSSKHEVPVTFWTYGPHGPQPSWRSIAVPGWDEIGSNYRLGTKEELEAIMKSFRPAHGGQLILWHGPAGTGKTFALRALAWEWRDWCEFNYIVDPDAFFGQHADYLMSVLLDESDGFAMHRMHARMATYALASGSIQVAADAFEDEQQRDPAWRLLVLEDAGELIQADARAAAGQGLSRFLNVVDGLIGQGLRVLVLVTTNEEIRKLHPAVARPGRCAANIEFGPLSAPEASAWLHAHGVDDEPRDATSLATLFAKVEGRDPEETILVGFGDT
ncbi:MAG TPA: ATP-binding protein [Gaiellaceae bacterium]|nr:ATP-binding protein [Gaiellaceae bacterium]